MLGLYGYRGRISSHELWPALHSILAVTTWLVGLRFSLYNVWGPAILSLKVNRHVN